MTTDNQEKKEEMVQVITPKELKQKLRSEFQSNYDKYYPVNFLNKIGFCRNQCEKCGNFFWNKLKDKKICGDSNCVGKYEFIGKKRNINGKTSFSVSETWDSFEKAFTTARIPCTKIDRYPVIARWRNDVEFVQAGIYCFQPYCVTGEM